MSVLFRTIHSFSANLYEIGSPPVSQFVNRSVQFYQHYCKRIWQNYRLFWFCPSVFHSFSIDKCKTKLLFHRIQFIRFNFNLLRVLSRKQWILNYFFVCKCFACFLETLNCKYLNFELNGTCSRTLRRHSSRLPNTTYTSNLTTSQCIFLYFIKQLTTLNVRVPF